MQIFSPPIPPCPHYPPPNKHAHTFSKQNEKKNNPKENFFKIKWLTSAGSETFYHIKQSNSVRYEQ